MPLVQTRGAASAQGFGEFAQAAAPANYIEDVFSTWLYTGTGSAQTITNSIDLSGKGGLVWLKSRDDAGRHILTDTVRGATKYLVSSSTAAQATEAGFLTSFNSNGFSIGADSEINTSTQDYVSWTFREQPKFFDIVTYTGTGSARTIAHNLGSVPGMIIVKRTDTTGSWFVYHRSLSSASNALRLNATTAEETDSTIWNGTAPTSSVFSVGTFVSTNDSGGTYVAYLFAHNAGGFGTAGTDNVISCGSYTTNGSGVASVTLGYEPQWILWKRSDSTSDWYIFDTMRGWTGDPANTSAGLRPNLSNAENNLSGYAINATGFNVTAGAASATYIYMAIRRGPMKVPTTGTSVFGDISASAEPVSTNLTTENGVLADLVVHGLRISGSSFGRHWLSRLTGNGNYLVSSNTNAEANPGTFWQFDDNNFAYIPPGGYANNSAVNTKYVAYSFKRAPGFFDAVCYDGNSVSGRTVTHNLTVAPELMIVKSRNTSTNWAVYCQPLGGTKRLILNLNVSENADSSIWNNTNPTSTVFSVGNSPNVNTTSQTYVAYLFATCAGLSKVGSYTGTGTTQVINCGFTGGARFVMIKRTDSTGDWYVWDSARGIVAGNDPYLLLNSTAAEVTNTDYVDTAATGFEISSTAPAAINANGGSFIFLAIA